jgi:AraC family transcriptional regulator
LGKIAVAAGELAVADRAGPRSLFGMGQTKREALRRHIATDVERAVKRRIALGEPGTTARTTLARGRGWSVDDVVCTRGPEDRLFEEYHSGLTIAVVVAGTFQYRTGNRRETLTPGSLLLGNDGQCFECDHDHATGDRCIAFRFSAEYFDRIGADLGGREARRAFRLGRLPPLREVSRLSAAAAAGLLDATAIPWEELSLELAAAALRLANGLRDHAPLAPRGAVARITASIRAIEGHPAGRLTLEGLAAEAGLSPFHYLRTFERVTGVTPHQFILRTRLREAATRLVTEPGRVLDIAFDAGFGDLSNFNHAFRAEFGMSPRRFRVLHRGDNRRPRFAITRASSQLSAGREP